MAIFLLRVLEGLFYWLYLVLPMLRPSRRRPAVSCWHGAYRVSERRACRMTRIPVSTFRYESMQEPRMALRLRIREIAPTRFRYGYRKIRVLLNCEGWKMGKKLVYRLYNEEGLTLRHKPRRKRRAAMHRRERFRPAAPNQVWGAGFCGRPVSRRATLPSFTQPFGFGGSVCKSNPPENMNSTTFRNTDGMKV